MPRAHSISSSKAAIENLQEWIRQDEEALIKWPNDERIKAEIKDKRDRIDFHRENIAALRAKNAHKRESPQTKKLRTYARKRDIINKQLAKKTHALEYVTFMIPSNPAYYEAQRTTFALDVKSLQKQLADLDSWVNQ